MVNRALIFFIFLTSFGFSQSKYPVDSLLHSPNIGLTSKVGLLPIAAWQRLSYNSNAFNCQFYPSCSNYGAQVINTYGWLKGGAMASDRIVRCNPFAFYYHLKTAQTFHVDGRLSDPVKQEHSIQRSKKSPWLAAGLSAILPGTGRMYAGRFFDGLMGLWTFYLFGKSSYKSIQHNRPIAGPLFGVVTGYIYFGEIYGAWRTASQSKESFFPNSLNKTIIEPLRGHKQ